ncbi:MAG: porin family protein [Hyphomicrobiaceae bacterium]|nr:MAG: porin family protein [Hyphomicrobiaceae bacterium]
MSSIIVQKIIKGMTLAGALALFAAGPASADRPHIWAGPYVGIMAGYAWTHHEHCDGSSGAFPNCGPFAGVDYPNYDLDGATIGGTLGYNLQADRLVLGIEFDYSWADLSGSSPSAGIFSCATTCASEIDAIATLRGRLGYSFDRLLPYITAGVAWTHQKGEIAAGTAVFSSGEAMRMSFVLGAGIEYAFVNNWSLKAEYLHIFDPSDHTYDNRNSCGTPGCFLRSEDIQWVRIGLNYRFGERRAEALK